MTLNFKFLNPQYGYLKTDTQLLNLASHDFWRDIASKSYK